MIVFNKILFKPTTCMMTPRASRADELMELVLASDNKNKNAGELSRIQNTHKDVLTSPDTRPFMDHLGSFNLQNIVDCPTHQLGHALDPVVLQMLQRC
jgi:hypothetical protein